MDHFDFACWTDYLHGYVPPDQRESMERHLLEGCEPCRRLADLVARIQQDASAELVVPDHLVNAAKAIFTPPSTLPEASSWMSLPRLAAELIFNGFNSPALHGARSAVSADAQMVYHAGDYAIRLQLERDPESDEVALVGQLTDWTRSGAPLSGIPVMLTVRAKLVAHAESNRFGEFCMVGRAQAGLTLRVPVEGAAKQVVIPLSSVVAAGS